MTAQIGRDGDDWVVTCSQHQWRYVAKGGQGHATNLAAKHDREWTHDDHTDVRDLHLSAAAAAVLRTDRGSERGGALMVWEALTGLTSDGALAYARQIEAHGFVATLPPF